MRNVTDWIKIYLYFVKIRILAIKEYRLDFFLGVTAILFSQAVNLIFLLMVFQAVPALNGWRLPEVMFIYAFAIFSMGVAEAFFGNIGDIPGGYIVRGKLDRLLLRPIPALLHVVADDLYTNSLGNITLGLGILVFSGVQLHLQVTFFFLLNFVFLLVSSVTIFSSIQLICACTCFWFVDRWAGVLQLTMKLHDFSRYPVDIFSSSIRLLITWVVPFAFTGYFPAVFLLGKNELNLSYITPVIAIIMGIIAYQLWLYGLRRYESSGT